VKGLAVCVWATLASTSTRDGQPFKAHPQGWLMYVVHNDTDWPVLVASVAGVEVGKLDPPHSTWQVRPPDERRLTATNEPVCLQFKIRGQNWRRDDMGEVCRVKRQHSH
jgi:hypothetical protein